MSINDCSNMAQLFKKVRERYDLTATQLSEVLDVTPQYISLIESQKKLPSEKVIFKLCNNYDVDLNYCIELRGKDELKRKQNAESNDDKEDIYKETKHSTPLAFPSTIPQLEAPFKGNSLILSLSERIGSLSDDIQQRVMESIEDIIDTEIENFVKPISHRDIKEKLIRVSELWRKSSNSPGYETSSNNTEERISLEGYLEISNSQVFFSLEADHQLLSLTTRAQDKDFIKEFFSVIPGVPAIEYSDGRLGRIFKNVPLFHYRLFNPASLVKEIKMIMNIRHLHLNKHHFQDFNLEPIIKHERRGDVNET